MMIESSLVSFFPIFAEPFIKEGFLSPLCDFGSLSKVIGPGKTEKKNGSVRGIPGKHSGDYNK